MSRRVAVLLNPTSGKGRGARQAPIIERRLVEREVDMTIVVGRDAPDALARARAAIEDGVDLLLACGGDGTVHLAAQALAGTDVALGIIPAGTGDDAARTLDIPRGDPVAAVDVALDGRRRVIDLGFARTADGASAWFICVLSTGFDSNVNERANKMTWPSGQARYVVATLAELTTFQSVPYTVEVDGARTDDQGMLVAIGNGSCYGGGMHVCQGAEVDDGLLTLTWLHRVTKPDFLRTFPKVFKGKHLGHPAVTQQVGEKFRIDAPGQVAYADGERIGPLPAEVEVRPGALTVMVPARAE